MYEQFYTDGKYYDLLNKLIWNYAVVPTPSYENICIK